MLPAIYVLVPPPPAMSLCACQGRLCACVSSLNCRRISKLAKDKTHHWAKNKRANNERQRSRLSQQVYGRKLQH